METEVGDEYICRSAEFVRTNEQRLGSAGLVRRPARSNSAPASYSSMLSWVGLDFSNNNRPAQPLVLTTDLHHLFYLLMRFEGLGIDVGSLDVHLDTPARPVSYISLLAGKDRSDTGSIASFRSTLSTVSKLSLGGCSFTKLPALSIHQTGLKVIAELVDDLPTDSVVPLDAFKNLQRLELTEVDPRLIMGWDRLSDSLKSLTIRKSGMEDISEIFIDAVLDDQARRLASGSGRSMVRRTRAQLHRPSPSHSKRSFVISQVPESVPESDESEASPTEATPSINPSEVSSVPSAASANETLPAYKWSSLRHLSLADNALTFIPSAPLSYFTSLTYLDLSSNLLVSLPQGLSALYNLVSLNLSDNMIESVLGIYTLLGQVLTLNLSKNRLDSLCGLERLAALERVDLRENRIEDCGEVGRLAVLPNINEVWVEGNPITRMDESYRVHCFDHFAKEGKNILLDGTPPSFTERMNISNVPCDHLRHVPSAPSPPVVAVSANNTIKAANFASMLEVTPPTPGEATPSGYSITPPASSDASPTLVAFSPASKPKHRKKTKRFVDLGPGAEEDTPTHRHARSASAFQPSFPELGRRTLSPDGQSPSRSMTVAEPQSPPRTPVSKAMSRHSRYTTESPSTPVSPAKHHFRRPPARNHTIASHHLPHGSVSPAFFDAPPASPGPDAATTEAKLMEAEAYRAKIEALRDEVGDSWLKVLSQSGGFVGSTSGRDERSTTTSDVRERAAVGRAAEV
ncbi:hypothetical protein BOTBODRAFT_205103 [Botryobasidium botryosum FD-172 SS1]|uniref:Uncharacterized protein n=1 Tax=Botryobasidium botryosum (strain FD-172 SS1) TaxID=930990 RepID=A0A067NCI8_BOTB1|nr:hypothetical protein BOTBODRAFT_205103 [Botryobasidium botryosum FD-172 SS1]